MDYATIQSREASFAPPSKRSKTGGWPHAAPKPVDLARAGFYFRPSAHSNDNAVCFLCSRNLDGWEKDDDPVQEHLKHAEDCGWAILMNIEMATEFDTSNMEDPTEQKLTDARRATFAAAWPHEPKRGWTCKVDKMVEAGWHFAPTSDSEDYVSCAYCKLSLDGWEPKDNPFEEHYSRSPSCPFFVFAGTTAPSKRPKAKKGRASRSSRTSKASARLSTQSNITAQSEAPSMLEQDESLNTSVVSLISTASTATAKGKRKASGSRAKTARAKKTRTTKPKKAELEHGSEAEQEVVAQQILEVAAEPEKQSTPEEQVIYQSIEPPLGPEAEAEEQIRLEQQQKDEPTPRPISPASSLGPPEREASAIPIAIDSPIPPRSSGRKPVSSQQQTKPSSPPCQTPEPKPKAKSKSKAAKPKAQAAFHHQATAVARTANLPSSAPSTPRSKAGSTSDLENAPPSTLPKSSRPPAPHQLPPRQGLSSFSPSSGAGGLLDQPKWQPIDIEMIFEPATPGAPLFEFPVNPEQQTLSDREKQMTVQDWIKSIASKAEDDVRMEGERLVSLFEREGQRAMGVLEGIVCV